jgi:CheY-like chemotaxis protein
MNGDFKQLKRVLFVDDSVAFLNMIEKVFGFWSKGSWHFQRALSGDRAIAILNKESIHLVVIDLIMPGMDGLQLLKILHKRHPDIPKIVLTGNPDEERGKECLAAGALHFLEKPVTMDSMEAVYRIMDELAEAQPEGGFQGMMWHVGLQEVLQIECLSRNSSVLEIVSGRRKGCVYVQNGEIIHAEAGDHRGIMALSYLLAFKGGEFNLKPFAHPAEITIAGKWEALLMEAAQTNDERGSVLAEKSESEKAGRTDTAFEQSSPVIEEVVVDSPRSPVDRLRGPKPEALIEFLDTLHEKTQQMSETLGAFDRMEIYRDKSHIVAEITADNRIRIHVYKLPEEIPPTDD